MEQKQVKKQYNMKKKNTVIEKNNNKWEEWRKGWQKYNDEFELQVKQLTFQSSILQVGLFLGYLVSAILLINFAPTFSYSVLHKKLHFILPYNDFPLWRDMSLIAGLVSIKEIATGKPAVKKFIGDIEPPSTTTNLALNQR
jgi:hypothetical protein